MGVRKFFLRQLFKCLKVKCKSDVDFCDIPEKAIFISNHVSFLDPLLIYAFLPGNPVLALNSYLLRRKWVRFFLRSADVIEFNPIDPTSLKEVLSKIEEGRRCFIFPEGRLTRNGSLMKIYEAPGIIADKAKAPIVPVWISGMEYSHFSILKGKMPLRPLPRVTINIGKPVEIKLKDELRRHRDYISYTVHRIMLDMHFKTIFRDDITMFSLFMKASKIHGKSGLFRRRYVLEDSKRKPQTFKDIVVKSFILGNYFKDKFAYQENVGVLMPNSCANLCSFFGLLAYNRVPAMLNFSSGTANVISMCKTALISNVITSREFIETAKLEDLIYALESTGLKIHYLEDIAKTFTLKNKLEALWQYKKKYVPFKRSASENCTVLFTSGSEGSPKAVVLTHSNLVANVMQCQCMIDINNTDTVFNVLPMFHCFGLTVGTIFPLIAGGKVFLYPSPLHYRIIPEIVYEIGATAMFATDTFFKGYAKVAHSYDFNSIRFILGGAESVRQDTRNVWSERFGVRLLEGYGATECSPVLTANNLVYCRFGSIGQLLPGIEYRFKHVDGIENGGILCVKGANIMKGYIKSDNPGKLVPIIDGWYETGDIGYVDDAGYFFITDRLKRFAKIGGEMISLTAVENMVEKCYEWMKTEFQYGAISIPHSSKGEQIVLATDNKMVNISTLQSYIANNGISKLFLPRIILYKENFPLMATGKRNNIELKKEILEELSNKQTEYYESNED